MTLAEIRGLGPARLEALRAMGIDSLRDLLLFLPLRYEDMTREVPYEELRIGNALVSGTAESSPVLNRFNGLTKITVRLRMGNHLLPVIWYNQPWLRQTLKKDQPLLLYGRVVMKNDQPVLQNPVFATERRICPVYREIKGLPGKTLESIILSLKPQILSLFPEPLPDRLLASFSLLPLSEAVLQVHRPDSMEKLLAARRRLAFDEMLMVQMAVRLTGTIASPGYAMDIRTGEEEQYWSLLDFPPTGAQHRVLHDIAEDMRRDRAMSRLVQGDVGCGKTAVAFGGIYLSFLHGFQSAMMAPTEILAHQHYEAACRILSPSGIHCRLLTGSTRSSEKKQIYAELMQGTCHAVFGTHALISEGVRYHRLGLVVTDEQHRFGVRQRTSLQEKGDAEGIRPHVLVMSATPIPRSLALILYGDLDLSVIDELPPGRKPVSTRLVPHARRSDMYRFLHGVVRQGQQAYVVCPLVEDSEALEEVRSAQTTFQELKENELKGLRVALTWGGQKPAEKEAVLESFQKGETDVLVSTTVVEVGVNVPNASVMIVENAERFGLSQLHQLRGRVGRGDTASWCFLVAESSSKLRILTQTQDGFLIAQKDLEIRGPGDIMGTRQSGQPLAEGVMHGDVLLLDEAVQCMKLLQSDPAYSDARLLLEREAAEKYVSRIRQIAVN